MSIDGFRPDAMNRTTMPSVQALAGRGSYTWGAQTINPSNTLPSHTSMLTGVIPTVHSVIWDEYLPNRGSIKVGTIFKAAKLAGKRTAMIVGKEKFLTIKDAGGVDAFVLTTRGDDDLASQAIQQIEADYDLVFLHFADVDLQGHNTKWLSSEYLARLNQVDSAIGRVLAVLPAHVTVILTADHGGSDYGHGTTAAVHMTIPWVIAGPRVKAGNALAVRVNTTDTAVTAAYILGIRIPEPLTGRVVTEAFVP
jgi:predicted AlkP superfamily pyrophosphatase or phosphodiesterase